MIDYSIIGQRIKHHRLQEHLTQEKLAEQVFLSTVYLSKIENGKVYPTLETYSNICSALKIDLGYLFSGSEIEQNNYANEKILSLFHSCSPKVKPIALKLLEDLSKL